MYECVEFRIRVQPSPETNSHEVCLLGDGGNLLDRFSDEMIGLDPDDLLVEPCPLRAQPTPHIATVGRCNCGEIGCGSVMVQVRREMDLVRWQSIGSAQSVFVAAPDGTVVGPTKQAGSRSVEVCFIGAQYDAELERALRDFSWETPDRTAARLLARKVDRTALERRGFIFDWASGRCRPGTMTVSLTFKSGPSQVLVNAPWDGKSVDSIVSDLARVLSEAPESWPNVEGYYPPKNS